MQDKSCSNISQHSLCYNPDRSSCNSFSLQIVLPIPWTLHAFDTKSPCLLTQTPTEPSSPPLAGSATTLARGLKWLQSPEYKDESKCSPSCLAALHRKIWEPETQSGSFHPFLLKQAAEQQTEILTIHTEALTTQGYSGTEVHSPLQSHACQARLQQHNTSRHSDPLKGQPKNNARVSLSNTSSLLCTGLPQREGKQKVVKGLHQKRKPLLLQPSAVTQHQNYASMSGRQNFCDSKPKAITPRIPLNFSTFVLRLNATRRNQQTNLQPRFSHQEPENKGEKTRTQAQLFTNSMLFCKSILINGVQRENLKRYGFTLVKI